MANSKLKCKFCGEYEYREKVKTSPFGKFCSDDHKWKFAKNKLEKDNLKKIAKLKRETVKEEKAVELKYKKRKEDFVLNDLPEQHKLTQPVFNKLRRLQEFRWFSDRGLEPECISCGKRNMDWCCGHFKTAGAQGNLRYDFFNTYLQCNRYCNKALSGNIEGNKTTRGYKTGLAERFGSEKAQEIIDYCETNTQVKKWSGTELKGMRKKFNQEIRLIEHSNK